jgi:hypothetical protein
MPHKEHARSALVHGSDLRSARYPDVRAMQEQVEGAWNDDIEVREAFAHCPQCGSGHFSEFTAESLPPDNRA